MSVASEAYHFVANKVKKRHVDSEPLIATDALQSFFYAKKILKGRFVLGEPAISAHAGLSFYYARDIVKGRFMSGEAVMLTDEELFEVSEMDLLFYDDKPINKTKRIRDAYSMLMKKVLPKDEYILFMLEF